MTARTSNGAVAGSIETGANKINLLTLDFDPAAIEYAQIVLPMPKSWNEGTITAKLSWTADAVGDVVWGVQAVAISHDDPLDAAFGAAVEVTQSVTAAGDLMVTAETGAITIGGVPAEADRVVIQIHRKATDAADTLNANDARLIAIDLFITYDAGNDA